METISVKTQRRAQMIDVTGKIAQIVNNSGVSDGFVVAFVPHTTAGITINENADPDVVHDILLKLEEIIPHHHHGYRHGEGNSDAHIKASLVGSSVTIMVENSQLCLGTWQGVYFCEFDGPRSRRMMVKVSK
jgi:secondary thiamine-phosphate synthase enzyme